MKIELTFLHSKVARRIFFLFITCALLPISILAVISFFQVAAKLQTQNQMELRQAGKARGMTILERLETLDAEIQTIILGLQRSNTTPHDELESHFLSITVNNTTVNDLHLTGLGDGIFISGGATNTTINRFHCDSALLPSGLSECIFLGAANNVLVDQSVGLNGNKVPSHMTQLIGACF